MANIGFPYSSGGVGSSYTSVNTYADLPDPTTVSGQVYVVLSTTGIIFINRKLAGFYLSSGSLWSYLGDTVDYHSVPLGGAPGQVLTKSSATDYDAYWNTPEVGGYDNLKYGKMLFEDFTTIDPSSGNLILNDFGSVSISSGTLAPFLIDENQASVFGLARISSSTSANSGRQISSYTGNKVFIGGEAFKTSLRFPSLTSDVVARFGFAINTDYSQSIIGKTIKSGAYFDLSSGVISGKLAFNSSIVSTTSTFTPSSTAGQYYRFEISTEWNGNSNGTLGTADDFFATFKIFNGATEVFSETIRLNYYTASYGYQFAGSVVVAQSTGTTAKEILRADYIQQYYTKELVR